MKNYTRLFITFFIFYCFSFTGISQKTKEVNKPFLLTKTSSMRYVSPLSSRQSLIPYEYVEKEAKDGRSRGYEYSPGTRTYGDDILTRNPFPSNEVRQGRAPSLVFDAYAAGGSPTDPSGAVGPNHYFTVFNTGFIIYDKSGVALTGQLAVENIFSSGGCCDLTVSYDNAADRWVVSYLFSSGGAEIAVSDGPDPLTTGWNLYTISAIQDYQKLSVWSDGYYITENTGGTSKIWALERDQMLAGNPAAQIQGFNLPGIVTNGFFSPQAFNVSNSDLPATGSLPIVYMYDNNWGGGGSDHIKLWEVDVDWVTSGNSSISGTPQQIPVSAFNSLFDNGSFSNLAQPSGGISIDALQATIMNQAQFRRFTGHNSAVFNFVVDVDGSSTKQAGIRWMEFRQSGDGQPWSLFQEGTYVAADNKHAWNASLAMDDQGNIGMGYTGMSSDNSTNGNVRVSTFYTGRLSGDTAGTMTIAEEIIAIGNGLFTNERYGDYSKIDVDPSDDQTFWFIDEYINNSRKGVVGVFKIAPDAPVISFGSTAGTFSEDTNCSYTDIDVPVNIALNPSANADVSFTVNGSSTATNLLDFELLTPSVTFPMGLNTSQNMTLRIYNDGFVESDETIIIDFTVENNGGNAEGNTNANSYILTINDDDNVPISSQNVTLFSEGFETYSNFNISPIGGWTMLDNDGDSSYGSITYDFTNENYTGTFIVFNSSQTTPSAAGTAWDAHSGNKSYYCFDSTGNVSGTPIENDDYIFSPQINLSGTGSELKFWAKSLTDQYGLERFRVGISTTNTNPASFTFLTPNPYAEAPIDWTEYTYDLTSYDGNDIYITFHVVSADAFAFMLDDVTVTTNVSTTIQTAVNTGSTNDEQSLATSGTIYTSDSTTGDVMLDITNNNPDDYGCLEVSVSRAGTGAQSYNGSANPDLVMDKTFEILSENTTGGNGDTNITFYFTEAEIAGWESVTSNSRNNLVIGREIGGVITEVVTPSFGAFGTDVTLTGNFTDVRGTYYFGTSNPVIDMNPCPNDPNLWRLSGEWSKGVPPTTDDMVIFLFNSYDTSNGDLDVCSLITYNDVTINAGEYIKVAGDITINGSGSLTIEHEGSLVQVDDNASVTNNGLIEVKKITPVNTHDSFSILGSPMDGTTRDGAYVANNVVMKHDTNLFDLDPNVTAIDPLSEHFADEEGDNWIFMNGTLSNNPAEGYLVGPTTAAVAYELNYNQGTLNNGVYNYPVIYNGSKSESANILSNPYASAIDVHKLIQDNNTIIDEVYYWEHLTPPGAYPGYRFENWSMGDISMRNIGGGVGAPNAGPPTPPVPSRYMPSGQGFGIKAKTGGILVFDNSMRVTGPNTGYRNSELIERLYIHVVNPTYQLQSSALIAFTEDATDGYESNYDSNRLATPVSIYSVLEDKELAIQGRSVFNENHIIPIGFRTQVDESQFYIISLGDIEGDNLSEATVYLKDNLLDITTNLSEENYTFTSNESNQKDRFVIVFTEEVLSNQDFNESSIVVYPNPTEDQLTIASPLSQITEVSIYDVRGRVIQTIEVNNQNNYQINTQTLDSSMYFVKITTQNGSITKRIIKQ